MKLSVLSEVISSILLPGSIELISCLLDTLSKVAHCDSIPQADVVYVEQLLMSGIENVATNVAVRGILKLVIDV